MHPPRIAFLLILSFMIHSCINIKDKTNKIERNTKIAEYIITKINKKKVHLFDIIDDIEFIKLSSDTNSIITNVDKLVVCNKQIIIYDRAQEGLLLFNDKGAFLNRIRSVGNGPNEYLQITDFTVSEKQNTIYVLASKGYKQYIFIYSLEGNLLNKYSIPFIGSNIILYDDCLFFYTDYYTTKNRGYNVFVLDLKGNLINKYFPYDKRKNIGGSIKQDKVFSLNEHKLYLHPIFNDTIYQINKSSYKPNLVLKYTDNSHSKELLNIYRNLGFLEFTEKLDHSLYISIDEIILYRKYAFFSYAKEGLDHSTFLDFDKNIMYYNDLTYNIKDADNSFLESILFSPISKYDDWLIASIDPFELHKYVDFLKKNFKDNEVNTFLNNNDLIKELFVSSKYNDNPIIIKYKLK